MSRLIVVRVKLIKKGFDMAQKQRNTYNYNLKQGRRIVYKGITSNIEKRVIEHEAGGKRFSHIEIVGRVKTEQGAKREEARQLNNYRTNHRGENPKYNRTYNG